MKQHDICDELGDMACFAAVAQYQGYTQAARMLGLSKSFMSRRVARLEEHLGVQLIKRTSRHFSLTETGQQYAQQCNRMLEQAEMARQVISNVQNRPQGWLKVSAPVMMTQLLLAPMLPGFLQRYPDVHLELLAASHEVNILQEGIDLAICARALPLADSGLRMRTLGQQQDIVVASPAWIEKHKSQLTGLDSLSHLPTLVQTAAGAQAEGSVTWALQHKAVLQRQAGRKGKAGQNHPLPAAPERHRIRLAPYLVSNNLTVLIQAVLAGAGVALLPQAFCQPEFEKGTLQQLFPEWSSPETIYAVFASRLDTSLALKVFLEYLVERLDARPHGLFEKFYFAP